MHWPWRSPSLRLAPAWLHASSMAHGSPSTNATRTWNGGQSSLSVAPSARRTRGHAPHELHRPTPSAAYTWLSLTSPPARASVFYTRAVCAFTTAHAEAWTMTSRHAVQRGARCFCNVATTCSPIRSCNARRRANASTTPATAPIPTRCSSGAKNHRGGARGWQEVVGAYGRQREIANEDEL